MNEVPFTYNPTIMMGQGVMSPGMEAGVIAFTAGIGLITVLMIVSWWRIFQKAKLPGWGILVPFYNVYLTFKLAGKPKWTRRLFFPPVLGILSIVAQFKIAKKFGKGDGFAIGLWLLPFIFCPILAFSKKITYTPEA